MSYATVDELAAAMRLTVTPKNQAWLQKCLDAAAAQIDHYIGRFPDDPLPTDDPTAGVVNVGYGVELYKLNDAAFGGVGFSDIGILTVPASLPARWAAVLVPITQSFGIA